MTPTNVAHLIAAFALVMSLLGYTGIDEGQISSAVNGIMAIVGIGSVIYAHYSHKQAVIAAGSAPRRF